MSESVLEFKEVSFSYQSNKNKRIPMIKGLNLQIHDGEFVSIIGPSGSGKSTIFRLIRGLEQPEEGGIFLNGKQPENRLGIVGYMPQQDLLMPWRTIMENAVLPLEIKGVKKTVAEVQVRGLLKDFGLNGVEHKLPGDLSGGMRQRVSFLRTVLSGSNILLLDEPFSALDAITRLTMQEWLIEQWEKWRKTILFITHDVDEALFLSDRIFVLQQHPISSLQVVEVPLDRPRIVRDLSHREVVQLKEHLIDGLRSKVNG
jgi:putative hydroxymethylpyrimidine transport system ATP-binding protein